MVESLHTATDLEALLSADGDGPATPLDAATAARLVEQAIDQATVRPLHSGRRRAGWMLAAALVLTGSAAAMYAVQHGAAPRDASQASATKPAPAAPVRNAPPQQLAAPQPLPEAQAPHRVVPSERAPQPRANEPRANEPRANEARNGEDLLERANRLRGDGQYRAAERTYLRVVAQTPTGAAAYSARVAAASLALEQLGEPKTALRLYEEAARTNPGGALSPEIHEGTAHAHRALGQRDAERRALNALLEEQPAGPAAERARKRLRVLDAGN